MEMVRPGPGRELEAEVLELVEALRHDGPRVRSTSSLAISVRSRFFTGRFWNGKSGGNASLNSRRPSVVSTSTRPSPLLPLRDSTMESGLSSLRSG